MQNVERNAITQIICARLIDWDLQCMNYIVFQISLAERSTELTPTSEAETPFPRWIIVLSLLISIVIIVAIVALICYRRNRTSEVEIRKEELRLLRPDVSVQQR